MVVSAAAAQRSKERCERGRRHRPSKNQSGLSKIGTSCQSSHLQARSNKTTAIPNSGSLKCGASVDLKKTSSAAVKNQIGLSVVQFPTRSHYYAKTVTMRLH